MSLTKAKKRKIEEEEKYRYAVAASVSGAKTKSNLKHGVPLLLSVFIPGLGQLVKGQLKKSLLIFFAPMIAFLFVLLINAIGGNGSDMLALLGKLWLGGIVLYFWQLYDAYNA